MEGRGIASSENTAELSGLLRQGWCHIRDGDYAAAETYFADLQTRYPSAPDVAQGRAWACALLDREDASRWMVSALAADCVLFWDTIAAVKPDGVSAPRTAGEALILSHDALHCGAFEDAVRFAQRAAVFVPDNGWVKGCVATALGFAGKEDEALPLLYTAARTFPTPAIWNNIGVIEAKRGNQNAAQAAWQSALAMAPEYHYAHNGLARAALRSGRLISAVKHWRSSWTPSAQLPNSEPKAGAR